MPLYTCPYSHSITCDLKKPCKKCRIIDITQNKKVRELRQLPEKEINGGTTMSEITKEIKGNEAIFQIPEDFKGKVLWLRLGNDQFEPTKEEMDKLCKMFMTALEDPKGAVVVTHKSVRADVLEF